MPRLELEPVLGGEAVTKHTTSVGENSGEDAGSKKYTRHARRGFPILTYGSPIGCCPADAGTGSHTRYVQEQATLASKCDSVDMQLDELLMGSKDM